MVLRFDKFDAVAILLLTVTISFIFAVSAEPRTATVSASGDTAKVPVIMYHHITEKPERAGRYTVLLKEFKEDLNYIKKNGYSTVTVSDLISFVNFKVPLPEKPIMITFDDGFESFYKLAFPLLKAENMKAVVSVIGSVTEKYSELNDHNINYSNITWNEICELNESGLIEIQSHTYDMHSNDPNGRKGLSKLKSENHTSYSSALKKDLLMLQQLLKVNCNITPTAVAYPYGAYSKDTLKIVKECGFQCTLVCEERINIIKSSDSESLFNLGRYNRPSGISTNDFFRKLT